MKHKPYSSKVRKNGQFDTGNSNRTIWYNSKLTAKVAKVVAPPPASPFDPIGFTRSHKKAINQAFWSLIEFKKNDSK